ncbi:MAG: TonB-dependent receptor [Filimonas sp.]|nr:TonB-dependent receptor [Filimonas sp.]
MLSKRILQVLFVLMMLVPVFSMAQVTTSSITGTVKTSDKKALDGASITATHQPSGTVYTTISRKNGAFNLPGLRIGGPYSIKIEYVGLKTQTFENVTLALGEAYDVNAVMDDNTAINENVVVTTGIKRKSAADKTGASTVLNSRVLTTMPTISRSITDFTRMTPQAGSSNSFAGRDGRYNNIQFDGANLNNNFGLSTDPLPGGGTFQPISLDAIDEIAVNIAPYDVRQSGFTGAGINAVTKSGNNDFHGSAYGYYRNEKYNGTKVGNNDIGRGAPTTNKTYGATFSGPIIKNKLFFFANYEHEEKTYQGVTFSPAGGSGRGNASTTPVDSLKKFSDFLRSTYGYETGAYDNFPALTAKATKFLARVDWNINKQNRLTVKYSDYKSDDYTVLNGSSIPNGGGFSVTGGTGTLSRLPQNRFSAASMSFENSNYGTHHIVRTGTVELNSTYSKISNQLLATITKIQDTRTIPGGQVFPTIDIFNGTSGPGQNYMSAGNDPFTNNNDIINNIYSFTDNFTYYVNKHTLTAGVNYEYQKVANMFMGGSSSYYAYNSLNDFMTGKAPVYYAYTYSLVDGKPAVYSAELKFAQLGFYVQDEIKVNNKFKLTAGIRIDKPIYTENPLENPAITALTFPDKDGNPTHYNTGKWPESRWLVSPRVGFRWDAFGDKSLIVRGGTGIFAGKIPFVFLTNIPTNSGMYQFGGAITNAATLAGITFNPKPNAYQNLFPSTAGATVQPNIVMVDPNFKFPTVFRTNLAIDKNLGNGFNLTLEALITKDINAVKMRNANLKAATGEFSGPDTRPRYVSTANSDRYIYPNITSAIVLENTSKGYSSSLTAMLSKNFDKGFYGSVAYTYSVAKDVTANPGNQASSVWNSNPNVGTSNDVELATSSFVTPHRIVANVSYRFAYAKHFATTISLFYQGSSYGNLSYIVNGDINGDGNSSTDLMFIPNSAQDLNFEQYSQTVNGVVYTFTAQQQAAALDKFINNSSYLSKHRGEYAGRYAARYPWYNRVDARFLQEFYINSGKTKHTLQFSADILNLPNLLNKYWGGTPFYSVNNPLVYRSVNANNQPVYRMANQNGLLVTNPFGTSQTTSSTWGLQLGLKYFF